MLFINALNLANARLFRLELLFVPGIHDYVEVSG
jgi:hypothetical protein